MIPFHHPLTSILKIMKTCNILELVRNFQFKFSRSSDDYKIYKIHQNEKKKKKIFFWRVEVYIFVVELNLLYGLQQHKHKPVHLLNHRIQKQKAVTLLRMCLPMYLQVGVSEITLVTYLTSKWLVTSMSTYMHNQICILGKSLATNVTFKRLLSRVCTHMH